jgi:hypothetical protein
MIRRTTWILLIALLLVLGGYFYVRDSKAKQAAAATPTPPSATVFGAAGVSPTDVKIESSTGTVVQIQRDQSGKWVLKQPSQVAADQAAAEAAATQVTSLKLLSTVDLGPDVLGLDKPSYTITVGYSDSTKHTLLVGSVTPIQNGYYVQLDGGSNQIADKSGVDALVGMLTKPPYLETPTSLPSPSPTLEPASPTPPASPTSQTGTGSPTATAAP